MLKLIKLEMMKLKISSYIRAVVIADIVIVAFLLPILITEKELNATSIFLLIRSLVGSTYIVFASVLIARLIIEEYKSKTIIQLFMYPINRKKLITAKLLIVFLFTLLSSYVSNIVMVSVFYIIDKYYPFLSYAITKEAFIQNLIISLFYSFASAGMALIPLLFGMIKKSVSATIISSLLVVTIIYSGSEEFSLSNFILIPATFAAIGIFISYLAFRNIERNDVI